MVLILSLVLLVAAEAVAGVLGDAGAAHAFTHGFSVFGYHVTGATGSLILYGIVVGAIVVLGLNLLLTSSRRSARRGREARRWLEQSHLETAVASQDRGHLVDQGNAARAETASATRNASPRPRIMLHRFGHRSRGRSDASTTATQP